ncbi:hypothetical protein StrepF001_43750 [Streptomyces sp. F001]|nr:hypothetical protein StrepF001_43750 [Streptomyces sp. F001]
MDPRRRLELRRFRGLLEPGAMSPSESAGGAKARPTGCTASPTVRCAKGRPQGSGSATAP